MHAEHSGGCLRVCPVFVGFMNMASMNIPSGPAAAGVGRLLLLGGAAVVGAINSLFNVEGGHRAIVFNRLTGIKDTVPFISCAMCRGGAGTRQKSRAASVSACRRQVYEEGTHLMIPWFERAIIYDVRARPNVIQSTSGSRDLQMVRTRPGVRAPPAWRCRLRPACITVAFAHAAQHCIAGQHRPSCADATNPSSAAGNLQDTWNRLCRAGFAIHYPGLMFKSYAST